MFRAEAPGVIAFAIVVGAALASWHLSGRSAPVEQEVAATRDAPESAAADAPDEVEAAPPPEAPPPPRRPDKPLNVVLITVDTLRFDLGYMGYPRPVSPNIDALAARSVVFERAYAMASYTPKSLGPMLIGRYASETFRDGEHYTSFYAKNVFLAERVQAAGGRTFGAMTHHYFRWPTGFQQGFDVWDMTAVPPGSRDNDPSITSDVLTDTALRLLGSPDASELPVTARAPAAADAEAPDAGAKTGPFLAWFHYLDPHAPYVPHKDAPKFEPDESIPRARAPYDVEVWFTDQQIGRLLAHIEAQPWAAETAIVLTADHGEAFGERGHWKHGRELWEPLVRVPLIVFAPGVPARRVASKRSHIDVVPTILDLMGLSAEEGELRGKSLLDDAFTEHPEERDVYMDMPEGPYNERRRALITGPSPGMKLIEFGEGRYELFDLAEDPEEKENLAGDRERRQAALDAMSRLREGLSEVPAPPPRPR